MYNEAVNAMMDGCRAQAEEDANVGAASAKMSRILERITAEVHSRREIDKLASDLHDAGHHYALALAEAMFVRAWNLRGNPDLIFELPNE